MNVLALFKKSSFAPAFLFLPAPRRKALAALYAFARAVDDAVDDPAPGAPPAAELERWRALVRDPDADGAGAPPAWGPLKEALEAFPINRRHLLDLIDGVARDAEGFRPRTLEDLKTYCHGVASTVGLACLPVFGLEEDAHRDFAVQLGWAVQTVNILRDVRADAAAGRVYLPSEDLERFGVSPADLGAARLSPAVLRLLCFEAERARGFFADAWRALPEESRGLARPALAMGALYEKLLDKMARKDFFWAGPRPSLSWGEKARVLASCWWRLG